jgi:hypothetical protein
MEYLNGVVPPDLRDKLAAVAERLFAKTLTKITDFGEFAGMSGRGLARADRRTWHIRPV